MTVVDDVKAVLVADSGAGGVYTLLTGGVYTYEDTGRLGPNQDSTPNAFNTTTGAMKPCVVVKSRARMSDDGVYDDAAQSISTQQVVELWFYDDGDTGYSTLESAQSRAFVVLHGKTVGTSKRILRWMGTPLQDARDPNLEYACIMRDDYDVRGMMG